MFDYRPMNSNVSPSLHPYLGPIFTVVKSGTDTLLRGSSFRRVYSESDSYLFHTDKKIIKDYYRILTR